MLFWWQAYFPFFLFAQSNKVLITLTLMMNFLSKIVFLPYDLWFISFASFLEGIPQQRCNYRGSTFYSGILRPWQMIRPGSRTHDLLRISLPQECEHQFLIVKYSTTGGKNLTYYWCPWWNPAMLKQTFCSCLAKKRTKGSYVGWRWTK